jgi:hypothetical protein
MRASNAFSERNGTASDSGFETGSSISFQFPAASTLPRNGVFGRFTAIRNSSLPARRREVTTSALCNQIVAPAAARDASRKQASAKYRLDFIARKHSIPGAHAAIEIKHSHRARSREPRSWGENPEAVTAVFSIGPGALAVCREQPQPRKQAPSLHRCAW